MTHPASSPQTLPLSETMSRQETWFLRFWFLFFFLLVLATWPLWWVGVPAKTLSICKVPVLPILANVSPVLQNLTVAAGFGSLIIGLVFPHRFRFLPVVSVTLFGLMILCDLSRLQAWWIVFALSSLIVIGKGKWNRKKDQLAKLVVVIYLFSGISKLDYQFAASLGPQFLHTLAHRAGFPLQEAIQQEQLFWISFLFPISEIAIACLLCWNRFLKPSAFLAIGMHLLLILILGPGGRNNQFGVLLWNLFFIGLICFCFLIPIQKIRPAETNNSSNHGLPNQVLPFLNFRLPVAWSFSIILSWTMGIGGIFGLIDPWPAWELYSPSSSRVELWALRRSSIEEHIDPAFLKPGVPGKPNRSTDSGLTAGAKTPLKLAGDESNNRWVRIDLAKIVLEKNKAPIYPHFRVQVPIAISLAKQLGLNRDLCIIVKGKSNRFSGQRAQRHLYAIDSAHRFKDHPVFSQ